MSLGKASDPKITPSNPWSNDPLSRAAEGKILANLISSLTDAPFVISLKGGWGTGKSIFLKRLGYYLENSYKIPVIRIDAWQEDYLDDPLLAMTSALTDRLDNSKSSTSKATDKIITGLAGSAGKIALPVLSAIAGITPAGAAAAEAAKTLSDLAENFLEWDRSRKSAEARFRENLSKARQQLKKKLRSHDGAPILIIIDELDRCRPDFAIKFLERIKHFFNVKGICFLIAVDHKNLPQAVKTLYGPEVDGELYLRKFFDFEFNLPPPSLEDHANQIFQNFPGTDCYKDASSLRKKLRNLRTLQDYDLLRNESQENIDRAEYSIFFAHIASTFGMQLRDSLQAHTLLMAFIRSQPRGSFRFPAIDCFISCLRFAAPQEYAKLVSQDTERLTDSVRELSKQMLKSIVAINHFLNARVDSESREFRNSVDRSFQLLLDHRRNLDHIDALAHCSLYSRCIQPSAQGGSHHLRYNSNDYLASVIHLSAAFTDVTDPDA
ncbi:KAP family P-loop NTPase fold protein [Stenotrophomonas maltophilia]|uniref:KAP family P-loop NTPase fold protein n=1 Tax=Stenotrophomonas maltophilia TaxID=40324 RepID=UPI00027A6F60|nr:P-loop NTPase fold protein [Stenotrophomonas maltophilia]EJP76879.1 hypothetical protein A1OC_01682 [Stenotrophomonas maltophilia Ab55555]ELE7120557.1 hypothetical protein [Stenotrophomonas maltophilia]HDS3806402.1 hypothetical protein [Stenotrophomonas maltophilia]HDX0801188.1 hypothetical protein [Stenotrophomonas maltophilia]HDX0816998.1 hypothetical protein [Stenotrophomonas maltophilia]